MMRSAIIIILTILLRSASMIQNLSIETKVATGVFEQKFLKCQYYLDDNSQDPICESYPTPVKTTEEKFSILSPSIKSNGYEYEFEEKPINITANVELVCESDQFATVSWIKYSIPKSEHSFQSCGNCYSFNNPETKCEIVSCPVPGNDDFKISEIVDRTSSIESVQHCREKSGNCTLEIPAFMMPDTSVAEYCDTSLEDFMEYSYDHSGFDMCQYAVWVEVEYQCTRIGEYILHCSVTFHVCCTI